MRVFREKNVMDGLKVEKGAKELTVTITRKEFSEYMMLRMMLAEAIEEMLLKDGDKPFIVCSLHMEMVKKIMPKKYREKLDELLLKREFAKSETEEGAK